MKSRKMTKMLFLILILSMLLVACGGNTTPTDTAPVDDVEPDDEPDDVSDPVVEVEDITQVAVLLPASQTDQGWNQQAADAMLGLADTLGVEVEVAENLGYGDITPVLRDYADRGFDLVICHASGYQTVCPEIAEESGMRALVVENPGAAGGVVADVETQAQEVAYLAGVLAGSLTTGTVGVVVSGEPPTWNFMTVGFAEGVNSVNPDAQILYSVIGEAAYEDAAGAKRVTETQLAAGADIIFGMGDGASFGIAQAVAEFNEDGGEAWFIDVIGNKTADYSDILLTSVLFDFSIVYEEMINNANSGGDFGQVYTMDVASGGIRLLELPDWVSADVVAAVDTAREAILAGELQVSAISDAEGVANRLDELASGEAAPAAETAIQQVAVLLPASQTDQGWNQQAADAMLGLADTLGVEVEVAENLGYGDITPVLRDYADRGFDLVICHASGYQTVCPEIAEESGMRALVVENPGAAGGVVADVETQAQEVAYLAGVLAGSLTSGTVGIVVSGEPPTWNFMTVGFAEGVKSVNPDAQILYSVIGEAAYEDAAGAKRVTETQLAAGADIIFGMGDGASFGIAQAVAEFNEDGGEAWFIDVIGNKTADYSDILLTSVLFDFSVVYEEMINNANSGGDFGQVYTMDVASGGIRLLELPDWVSADIVAAVDAAREAILSGDLVVSAISDAEGVATRLNELK